MPLRVWCEFLPYEQLRRPEVLRLLRRYNVMLCLSVPSHRLDKDLAGAMQACADAGVPVGWWVLMPEAEGYWPSEGNVFHFEAQLARVREFADRRGLPFQCLAVDLELPLTQVRRFRAAEGWRKLPVMLDIAHQNLTPNRYAQAVSEFQRVQSLLHADGIETLCAAMDLVLEDVEQVQPTCQDLFETPVLDVSWDRVSVMLYNTLMAQLLGCSISQARGLQYLQCKRLKQALESRAAVSLGLTGVGVLGDEPIYKSPQELMPDVAAARAAGIEDIALYNLEGILASSDPGAWFQVVQDTEPRVPGELEWASGHLRWRRHLVTGLGLWRRLKH